MSFQQIAMERRRNPPQISFEYILLQWRGVFDIARDRLHKRT
jgi:hypothetical protein